MNLLDPKPQKGKVSIIPLIWEFGTDERPDWVHVSYNSDGEQRGQILTAKRNSSGKVYYTKSYEA